MRIVSTSLSVRKFVLVIGLLCVIAAASFVIVVKDRISIGLLLIDIVGDILCYKAITNETSSDDGKYQAYIMVSDCGATTSRASRVLLMEGAPWLRIRSILVGPDSRQQVTLLTVYSTDVFVTWKDSRRLHIEYHVGYRVRHGPLSKPVTSWQDVEITYAGWEHGRGDREPYRIPP